MRWSALELVRQFRSLLKTRREILRRRGWTAEDWYRAWQTTDLPQQMEAAARWLAEQRA